MVPLAGISLLALEILGVIFFFNKKKSKPVENEDDQDHDHLFCRFVIDGIGRKIGESVSIDGDIIIIKSGARFLGVPLKHIEESGKDLLVKGLVDFSKAYELGEEWRKESFSEVDQKGRSEGK